MDPIAALLAENRKQSAEFGGQLSNHFSMAVVALWRMGVDMSQIDAFATAYRNERALVPLPNAPNLSPTPPIGDLLGQQREEAGLRRFFETEINNKGRDSVLRESLPFLLPGLSASAFHAMIRTAYAVEADDGCELAAGLAYWVMAFGNLGRAQPGAAEACSWRQALQAVAEVGRPLSTQLHEGLIFQRLEQVARNEAFSTVLDRHQVASLPELAEMSVALLAATGDFTALHAVTATHAFRVLKPWMTAPDCALASLWRALAAAYVTIGAPQLPHETTLASLRADSPGDWRPLHAAAIASQDDHKIKLLYSTRKEAEIYGDAPLYRAALAGYLARG